MASGEPLRAPIIRSSSPANRKASAKAPRNCLSAAATASTGGLPFFISSVTRWATTSVSVSLPNFDAVLAEPFAQLAEILDDAVMRDRDAVGGVRMSVALGRLAVGRPAGVADADIAGERLAFQALLQRLQLAFGAPAPERAVIQGGDAGGIIAAVFEALERFDQMAGDRLTPDNSDDPAHPFGWPLIFKFAL